MKRERWAIGWNWVDCCVMVEKCADVSIVRVRGIDADIPVLLFVDVTTDHQ